MKYMICYDLRNKNKKEDYEALRDKLKELGAYRVLRSQWILDHSDTNTDNLLSYFLKFLDSSDRLLIIRMSSSFIISKHNLITDISTKT